MTSLWAARLFSISPTVTQAYHEAFERLLKSSYTVSTAFLLVHQPDGLTKDGRELFSVPVWELILGIASFSSIIHCLIWSFFPLQIVPIDRLEILYPFFLPVSSWENIWMPPDLWHLFHLLISQVTDSGPTVIPLSTFSALGNKLCLRLEKWTHFKWWDLESKTLGLSLVLPLGSCI